MKKTFAIALCLTLILALSLISILSSANLTGLTSTVSTSYPTENTKVGDADLDGDVDTNDARYIAENAVGLNNIIGSKCHVDVNLDRRVDVLDALIVAQMAQGLIPMRGTCGSYASLEPSDSTLIGDADLDGDVDYDDAQLIARYAAGLLNLPKNICNLDLNFDGYVTVLDSLIAAQIAEGLRPSLGTCRDRPNDNDNGFDRDNLGQDDLEFNRIDVRNEFVRAGDILVIGVDVETGKNLKDVRVRATIPELGITRSGRYFDLNKDDEFDSLQLDIPLDAQPGNYNLEIYASNDNSDLHRIKHREITVI